MNGMRAVKARKLPWFVCATRRRGGHGLTQVRPFWYLHIHLPNVWSAVYFWYLIKRGY